MIKLAIGVPAYGGSITAYQAEMWLSLGQALVSRLPRFHQVMFGNVDVNGVDRARNFLVAHAMQFGADWLLMVDADTWAVRGADEISAGSAILRMIDEADQRDIAVVAAPVRIRTAEGSKQIAAFRRHPAMIGPAGEAQYEIEICSPFLAHELPQELHEVSEVGAACLAINLHAVDKADARFKFTDKLSEDREFCRQMREAGFKIAVDGRVRTGHLSKPLPLYSE